MTSTKPCQCASNVSEIQCTNTIKDKVHVVFKRMYTGADPGFLDSGFKFAKPVWLDQFTQLFSIFPMKIIYAKSGVQANLPNPLWICYWYICVMVDLRLF